MVLSDTTTAHFLNADQSSCTILNSPSLHRTDKASFDKQKLLKQCDVFGLNRPRLNPKLPEKRKKIQKNTMYPDQADHSLTMVWRHRCTKFHTTFGS